MVFSIGPRTAGDTLSSTRGASRNAESRRAAGTLSVSEVDRGNNAKEQTQLRANPDESRTNEARKSAAREKIEVSKIAGENEENANRIQAAKQTISEVKSLLRQREQANPEQKQEIDQLVNQRLQSFADAEDTKLQEQPELAESRTQSGNDVETDTQRAKNIERPGVESLADRGLRPGAVDTSDPRALDDLEEVVRLEEDKVRAAAPQIQERISTTFVQASALADQSARTTPEQLAGGVAAAIRQSETFNDLDGAQLNRSAIEVLLTTATPTAPSQSSRSESESFDRSRDELPSPPPRSAASSPSEATKLLA